MLKSWKFKGRSYGLQKQRVCPCIESEPAPRCIDEIHVDWNIDEKSVVEGKGKSGYKVVSFERTPVMSTYVSFAKAIISSDTDMEIISCSPGLLETLSMSKALRRGSTTARTCLFECTQREV